VEETKNALLVLLQHHCLGFAEIYKNQSTPDGEASEKKDSTPENKTRTKKESPKKGRSKKEAKKVSTILEIWFRRGNFRLTKRK
jgi:hypothetical protein